MGPSDLSPDHPRCRSRERVPVAVRRGLVCVGRRAARFEVTSGEAASLRERRGAAGVAASQKPHERRRLPFGEYVPGAAWVPALRKWQTTGRLGVGWFRRLACARGHSYKSRTKTLRTGRWNLGEALPLTGSC